MKLREIFRFELAYQLRSVQTGLFFAVLGVVAFISVEANFLAARWEHAAVEAKAWLYPNACTLL